MNNRVLLIIVGFIIVGFVIVAIKFNNNDESSVVEVNAIVRYQEDRFIITNNDSVDFVNADLSIDEYFKIRNINLKAGETYTVWPEEFLHHNGRHYPSNRQPIRFSIWCELQDGRNGFYLIKIN